MARVNRFLTGNRKVKRTFKGQRDGRTRVAPFSIDRGWIDMTEERRATHASCFVLSTRKVTGLRHQDHRELEYLT